MRYFLHIFFLFSTLLFSCTKEKDTVFPTIIISSPNENSDFKVLEGIPLKVNVNDNENLESVRVSLSEVTTGKIVLSSLNFYPNSSSFSIDQDFSISDSLLNSGQYSLRVDAYDGENTSSSFVSIDISGIPLKSLSVIMALERSNTVDFVERYKDQSQTLIHTSASLGELAINSRYQQLWFSEVMQGTIVAFDLRRLNVGFNAYPNSNGQNDRISDVCMMNDRFYVSTDRGSVQAFSPSYQDVFTYQSNLGLRVEEIYPLKDRIVVRENNILGTSQNLLYLFGNGSIDSRLNENGDVGGITYKDSENDQAHLFVNQTNGFEVKQLDLASGQASTIASKSNIQLESLIRIRDFEFVLISSNAVYSYNLSTGFTRTLASNLNSPKVAYDKVESWIYIASGTSLKAFDYQSGNLVLNSNQAFPIIDLAIRYNK